MGWFVYPVYVLDLALMIFLSFFLGDLVDMLDKKTKISGAFIGGVLLAAVTSLPELFTAFSSIILVKDPSYVVGDILGSIIFDLVLLALETFIFFKNFRTAKLDKMHFFNGIICLGMYVCAGYAFFVPENWQLMLGDINAMSIIIFGLYILTIVLQPKEVEKDEEEAKEIKWSLKKIVTLFTVSSILLIGSSIALTYLTKEIQNQIPALSGSVAGALLLGIGTSIPEIISTAQLFRKKNYDAGFGNMIGSCTFDFGILALADFMSWHQLLGSDLISQRGIFIIDADSTQFELFGAAVCALFLIIVGMKVFSKIFEKHKKIAATATGAWAVLCTAMYLTIFIL